MIETHYYGPITEPHNNKIVGDFVSLVMFGERDRLKNYCSMAVVKDEELIAGVIYNAYYPGHGVIEISACATSKLWLTRRVIHAMFSLPFDRLGCQMVILRTSEKNGSVRGLLENRFDLSPIYLPRMRGRDEGEYQYSITEECWRDSPYSKEPN